MTKADLEKEKNQANNKLEEKVTSENKEIILDKKKRIDNEYDILGYNKEGYDKEGYDKQGYDKRGFSRDKIHRFTQSRYDREGYDFQGYDEEGYNRKGINRKGEKRKEKLLEVEVPPKKLDEPNNDFITKENIARKKGKIIENKVNIRLNENILIKERVISPKVKNIQVEETEVITEVKARRGHIEFKKNLLAIDNKCKICGLSNVNLLVASHIKPWSVANSGERVDYNNGFLFCPNHDSLFDKGFISFDNEGKILISNYLKKEDIEILNLNENIKIKLSEGNKKYLEYHRKFIFKK